MNVRLRQMHLLQVRTTVQRKKFHRCRCGALDIKPNAFVGSGVRCQRAVNAARQLFQSKTFEQPQNADVFPLALLAGLLFQTAAQHIEGVRKVPRRERCPKVKTIRTTLCNGQIVDRIVMRLLDSPITFMLGNDYTIR